MRRLARRLFAPCSALSVLLCIACVVWWACGIGRSRLASWERARWRDPVRWVDTIINLETRNGAFRLSVVRWTHDMSDAHYTGSREPSPPAIAPLVLPPGSPPAYPFPDVTLRQHQLPQLQSADASAPFAPRSPAVHPLPVSPTPPPPKTRAEEFREVAVERTRRTFRSRPTPDWRLIPAGPRFGFGLQVGPLPGAGSGNGATTHAIGVVVPAVLPAAGFALLPVLWLVRRRRRRRAERVAAKICLHCGYDLRASPGRCPECGTTPLAATAIASDS